MLYVLLLVLAIFVSLERGKADASSQLYLALGTSLAAVPLVVESCSVCCCLWKASDPSELCLGTVFAQRCALFHIIFNNETGHFFRIAIISKGYTLTSSLKLRCGAGSLRMFSQK